MAVTNPDDCLAALAQIRDAAQQRAFIAQTEGSPTQPLLEAISDKIRELLPRDPDLAQSLAETSLYIAELLDTPLAWAYAKRSRGQVLWTMRKSTEAEPYLEEAVGLFEQAGLSGEVGRTLVLQMDNLIYLSRYSEALALRGRARGTLEKANDGEYLCTLEIALGNLYYRLNRYSDSLAHYDRAQQKALENADNDRIAAIGLGRAHVLTEMNRFEIFFQQIDQSPRLRAFHKLKGRAGITFFEFQVDHVLVNLIFVPAEGQAHLIQPDISTQGFHLLDGLCVKLFGFSSGSVRFFQAAERVVALIRHPGGVIALDLIQRFLCFFRC